jgi:NitT/TauT family transport system substrate-binding protein
MTAAVACGGGGSSSPQAKTSSQSGGSGGSGSVQNVSLRLDFVHTGKDAIWTYGIQKGFFKKNGIKLNIEDGKGSATTAQTTANGSDDFGEVGGGAFLTLASKGLPGEAIMSVVTSSPAVILSPKEHPITRPEQLVGKKVGLTPGGGPGTLLPALLARNGVEKSKVHLVNLQPGPGLTILLKGSVDADVQIVLVRAILAAKGLQTHAMFYKDFCVQTPGYYITTSKSMINDKPDLVRSFVKAAAKSIDATLANPQAAADSFAKHYPDYTSKQALAELKTFLPLVKSPQSKGHATGFMSVKDAKTALTLLSKYGDANTSKLASVYLDSQFLPKG